MCNAYCVDFFRLNLGKNEIEGKDILDVGSLNVNGSARDAVIIHKPNSYIGVDLATGYCVDRIVNAEKLLDVFAPESFDIVVSTEMLEHCGDWKVIIHNIKTLVKPGGSILITTRSKGFPYHEWPIDHWRFEIKDMQVIFSDFNIVVLQSDPKEPGVFIKAVKPLNYTENDLSAYKIYEVVAGKP